MKRALIVFAKVPQPGRVKTRLTSLLSPEWAAKLYEAFLRDALAQYSGLGVAVRLYLSPPLGDMPADLIPDGVAVFKQQGEGLGARMAHSFVETFMAGFDAAVIIGTDHPTLPSAFIEEAFHQLESPYAISIGPSDDGGYYLLGMNEFYGDLFNGMTYSHADVFDQTVERALETSGQLSVLPAWYDVDTPETLSRLIQDLDDSIELSNTRPLLEALMVLHPELNRSPSRG